MAPTLSGQPPVRGGVEQGAEQEAGRSGSEAAGLDRLVHQFERQGRDQHAAAEGHDGRDQPLGHLEPHPDNGAQEQRGARQRSPASRLQPSR